MKLWPSNEHWISSRGVEFDILIVFSNALVVVDSLNGFHMSTSLELVLSDCLLICSRFEDYSFMYLNMSCNTCVHFLVGLGHIVGAKTLVGLYLSDTVYIVSGLSDLALSELKYLSIKIYIKNNLNINK